MITNHSPDGFLPAPSSSSRRPGFVAACWLLAVAGGITAFGLGAAGAMSSDSCRPDDNYFICTSAGQNLVFWLPIIGWVIAMATAWLTTTKIGRYRKKPWLGIAAATALNSAVMYIDYLIVSTSQPR